MGTSSNTTDKSFDSDVVQSQVPVLVDFWAEWCGPCKALTPKLEEIAGEMGSKIKIVKMNVDENQGKAAEFGIRSIPTMILFKDGKPVGQMMGNHPKDNIVKFLNEHV